MERAIRALDELISKYPAAPEPYNNLARLHARRGDLEKAREILERGLAGDPAYATLYRNLTGIYEAQARTAYAKALDLGDADPKPDLKPLLVLRVSSRPTQILPKLYLVIRLNRIRRKPPPKRMWARKRLPGRYRKNRRRG